MNQTGHLSRCTKIEPRDIGRRLDLYLGPDKGPDRRGPETECSFRAKRNRKEIDDHGLSLPQATVDCKQQNFRGLASSFHNPRNACELQNILNTTSSRESDRANNNQDLASFTHPAHEAYPPKCPPPPQLHSSSTHRQSSVSRSRSPLCQSPTSSASLLSHLHRRATASSSSGTPTMPSPTFSSRALSSTNASLATRPSRRDSTPSPPSWGSRTACTAQHTVVQGPARAYGRNTQRPITAGQLRMRLSSRWNC